MKMGVRAYLYQVGETFNQVGVSSPAVNINITINL